MIYGKDLRGKKGIRTSGKGPEARGSAESSLARPTTSELDLAAAECGIYVLQHGNVTPVRQFFDLLKQNFVSTAGLREWLEANFPIEWRIDAGDQEPKFWIDRKKMKEIKKTYRADKIGFGTKLMSQPWSKQKKKIECDRRDLMRAFEDALHTLADPAKRSLYGSTGRRLAEIEGEWARLERLPFLDGYFRWPTTEALGGDGSLRGDGWVERGLLAFMGYRVGRTNGTAAPIRHILLARIFAHRLPPVDSPQYMQQWGKPSTPSRLKKMADTIASLAKNAKVRRNANLVYAVEDWEADLAFLYETYYVSHFRFAWPLTGTG